MERKIIHGVFISWDSVFFSIDRHTGYMNEYKQERFGSSSG